MRRKNHSITEYEDLYATYLSHHNIPFARQEVICKDCGYHASNIRFRCPKCKNADPEVAVVDFLIPDISLVIEIGGDYIHSYQQEIQDMWRTKDLNSVGYKVIRIPNKKVVEICKNLKKVPHFLEQKL